MEKQYKDYNMRLIKYIEEQVVERHIPPTIEEMLQNVPGLQSKSSVFYRLQKLVKEDVLVKVDHNGRGRTYYWPKSLYATSYIVTHEQIKRIMDAIEYIPEDSRLDIERIVKELLQQKEVVEEKCG